VDILELGSGKKPIDVRGAGAFSMNGESDLVGFVLDQLLPRLPTRGKTSDQQLGQQGLGLGLWVYDTQSPLGGQEH